MDDLISRKAAIEAIKELLYEPDSVQYIWSSDALSAVKHVHSVPAVPLDKLCEWLNINQGELPPCPFDDDCYECGLDGVACIKKRITAWMEEQDATD